MDAVGYRAGGRPDRRVWRGSAGPGSDDPPEVRVVRGRERGPEDDLAVLRALAGIGRVRADPAALIADILELVGEVLDCERPLLFLWNGDCDELIAHSLMDPPRRVAPPDLGVVGQVLSSDRSALDNDAATNSDADWGLDEGTDARQVAAAPLTTGNGRLGAVIAVNSRRGAFVERELATLTSLASTAAFLLENARLHGTINRRTRELSGLQRLAQLLASTGTLADAVVESERIVCEMLSCGRCMILLYDENANSLIPAGDGEVAQEGDASGISLAVPSLPGTVFRTQTALVSNDARGDPWVGEALKQLLAVDNCLVVPITSGSRSIGVLVAVNATSGAFDSDDLHLTTLLGVRIGSVVEASSTRERDRRLLVELRESDRNRSDFVSMLAHELKGPMTTIKGFAEILHKHPEEIGAQRRAEYSTIISSEIDRLCDLVNDLLDVARMDAGTLRTEPRRTQLAEVVDDLLMIHGSLRAEHDIDVVVADDLPPVFCDPNRIRQVLLNLLQNATRYSPASTTVSVSIGVVEEGGRQFVRASVIDEGIGISPEDRERVFSKFVMLPKPEWAGKGTGLGLYIARGIVEAHGGRIWVEGAPDKGSSFSFTLPAIG